MIFEPGVGLHGTIPCLKVIRSRPLECIADGRVTRVLHGFT